MKAGTRLASSVCTTEIVVVRASADVAEIACCGEAMIPATSGPKEKAPPAQQSTEEIQIGKRYENPELGLEVLCVRAGAGELSSGGQPLTLKASKPLPSSD